MNDDRLAMNRAIIEEFRNNDGVVGGQLAGVPLLLLHHTGVKSGSDHVAPLAYLSVPKGWVVVAANGGRPTHPQWYFNLQAEPNTTVEVGAETHEVAVRFAEGDERDALVERFRAESPMF